MKTRIDMVVDRDPDGGTDVHLFINGHPAETTSADDGLSVIQHTIDPESSGGGHGWYRERLAHHPDVPETVRWKVEELAGYYHECKGDCPESEEDDEQ